MPTQQLDFVSSIVFRCTNILTSNIMLSKGGLADTDGFELRPQLVFVKCARSTNTSTL